MKLVVNGVEYDGAKQPFIGDLRLLKPTVGFGWGTVIEHMSKIKPDASVTEVLDDDGFLTGLLAWMWMVRRRAGERDLTWDEVGCTAIDEIQLIGDDPSAAEEAAEDPTQASAPTGSVPVDAKPAPRKRPSGTTSSKTSNVRSISA